MPTLPNNNAPVARAISLCISSQTWQDAHQGSIHPRKASRRIDAGSLIPRCQRCILAAGLSYGAPEAASAILIGNRENFQPLCRLCDLRRVVGNRQAIGPKCPQPSCSVNFWSESPIWESPFQPPLYPIPSHEDDRLGKLSCKQHAKIHRCFHRGAWFNPGSIRQARRTIDLEGCLVAP